MGSGIPRLFAKATLQGEEKAFFCETNRSGAESR